MSPLKTSLLTALVAAAITTGSLYVFYRHRTVQASDLRRANRQMQAKLDERRNKPIGMPLAEVRESADLPHSVSSANEPLATTAPKPIDDYRNEGNATPLATLQTFAWACDRGDAETVAKLLYFEGTSRAKAEAFMATLPDSARGSWRTPEDMAATLLTAKNMNTPFPHARILESAEVETISEGRVMLRLPDTPKDRTQYQKTDDGWKYLITEAEVDAYLARVHSAPSPSR